MNNLEKTTRAINSDFLKSLKLPPPERRAIIEHFKDQTLSTQFLAPRACTQTYGSVNPKDRSILHELISEKESAVLDPETKIHLYRELSNKGIFVEAIEGTKNCLILSIDFPFEEIITPRGESIRQSVSELIERFVIKEAQIKCTDPQPITMVYNVTDTNDISPTRGNIEITKASLKSILPETTVYYEAGTVIAGLLNHSRQVAEDIQQLDKQALKTPVQIYVRGESEDFTQTQVIALDPPLHSLEGIPHVIREKLLSFTDADGVCAINPPLSFVNQLYQICDPYMERGTTLLPISDKPFWATGKRSILHDDGWFFEHYDGGTKVFLARPDPSFLIPEGGILHTYSENIGESFYDQGICIVPMLPPALTHYNMTLSRSRFQPALVLEINVGLNGEIKNVSLENNLVRLKTVYNSQDTIKPEPRLISLANVIADQEFIHIQRSLTYDDIVKIFTSLAEKGAAAYAQEKNLPTIYKKTNPLLERTRRLARLQTNKHVLGETIFSELFSIIDKDDLVQQYIHRLPEPMQTTTRELFQYRNNVYSKTPFVDEETSRAVFGPPLRSASSLSTILSWSRALRGRPYEKELRGIEPNTTLQNALLTGAYIGKSIFNDELFTVTQENSLKLINIKRVPEIPLEDLTDKTIIKGFNLHTGKIVLKKP